MSINNNTVQFTVDLNNNKAHLFKVTMVIDNASINQQVYLPVWTPGSYMVREFSQHIVSMSATEHQQPVAVEKINKNTWKIKNTQSKVVISYHVYAFDSSIRSAYLDDRQGFFNGTALFLCPTGFEDADFLLTIVRPEQESFAQAQAATNLTAKDVDRDGFGTYRAQTYQSLVDHPFQISTMKRLSFKAGQIPHDMVLVGDVRTFDEERLIKDLVKICETQIALFDGKAPFSSYLFIARFEEGGHGGLEHNNSTMLLASPYCLPKIGLEEADAHYRNFLSLCSHEYFHAWNVKELKPKNFVAYNLHQECYTTMLWIFEGITSYYDDLLVKRAGLITTAAYLELMGKNHTRLLKTKGRLSQSLAESSFDAWIKFYRQNENSQNTSVSYYLKGSLTALLLDLTIRYSTENAMSLDEVMRRCMKKYGGTTGLIEEDFFAIVGSMGINSQSFRTDHIYGTSELDLASALEKFGVLVTLNPDDHCVDEKTKMSSCLGLKLKFDDNGQGIIGFVEQGGPAMQAGLCPYDEVIAINNCRLDSHNASEMLSLIGVNKPTEILYARKKTIRQTLLMPAPLPVRISKWSLKPTMDEKEQKRQALWLNNSVE